MMIDELSTLRVLLHRQGRQRPPADQHDHQVDDESQTGVR
jgi:hypothetical protein